MAESHEETHFLPPPAKVEYTTKEAALLAARQHAKNNGYGLIIKRSKQYKSGGYKSAIYLTYDRSKKREQRRQQQ